MKKEESTINGSQFLIDVRMAYNAKNEYQSAVIIAVRTYDRLLTTEPENFLAALQFQLKNLHTQWPRTKMVSVDLNWYRGMKGDISINIYGTGGNLLITIDVKKINGRFDQAGIQPFIPFGEGGVTL